MSFSLLHPRDQIAATMDRIYGRDMTTTSGGNISVRDENGDVWITPARVDKGNLRPEDIVCVRADGTREGAHPASSECPFHLGIYAVRPDIRAIVHAHPGALVSFSICGQAPNTRLFPEARSVCGQVAFAPYALPGSKQLGDAVAKQFAIDARPSCVMLENHGVVVGGEDLASAFQRFETLEFTARTILRAHQLGDVRYLSDAQIEHAWKSGDALPECAPRPPSSLGKEMRKAVCNLVHRAYEHGLMTSTWGSFSARIQDDTFVITPQRVDRHSLEIDDLVIVRDGRRAIGRLPSRAARLHRAIYMAHPEINAIVNALPVNATAFSVSDAPLETRTIPESYLFLKDVQRIPFEAQFGDGAAVAEVVGPKSPIALLENNGALVAGRSPLDAFDRLEVLESTAAALIRSRALGPIRPMSNAIIDELVEAFPSV